MDDSWDPSSPTWFIRVGADKRGPVSLDQVERAVQVGLIPPDAEVGRPGHGQWVRVQDLLEEIAASRRREPRTLPPLEYDDDDDEDLRTIMMASPVAEEAPPARLREPPHEPTRPESAPRQAKAKPPPAADASGPPLEARSAQRTAKTARLGRRVIPLVAVGVAVALIGGAVATYLSRRGQRRSLPVLAQRLPPRTTLLVETRLRPEAEDLKELPDAYVTSSLADIACGGRDLAALLGGVRGRDVAAVQAAGLLELATDRRWSDALACGEAMRKQVLSPNVVRVEFTEADRQESVSVIRSSMVDPPQEARFVRHTFSGLPGYCAKRPEDTTDCSDGVTAGFHDAEMWVFGSVRSVEAFARSYTTAREELTTTVEILRDTVQETVPADVTQIWAKPDAIPWRGLCYRFAPTAHVSEFSDACFPAGQERLLNAVATKVRGLAVQHNLLARGEGVHMWFTLVTRDAEAAEDVEKDLLDLARDWKTHVANREPDLVRMARAPSDRPGDRLLEPSIDALLRAIRGISVERSGVVVRFIFRESFRPAESKAVREFVETGSAEHAALVKVVDAMAQRAAISPKSLEVFLGPVVTTWVLAPRATTGDCDELAAKLKLLVGARPPAGTEGLVERLGRAFGREACVGNVLPAESKTCMVGAATLSALEACRLPVSPYVYSAVRRLMGRWEIDSVNGRPPNSQGRRQVSGVRLEITDSTCTMVLPDGTRHEGALKVTAESLDSATLAMPVRDTTVIKVLRFEREGIKVLDLFERGDEVSFRKVSDDAPAPGGRPPAPAASGG